VGASVFCAAADMHHEAHAATAKARRLNLKVERAIDVQAVMAGRRHEGTGSAAKGAHRQWLQTCFPARGLPQSGSKGLSQSMPFVTVPTPLAKWHAVSRMTV
jgi:hypothetical protein